MKTPTTSEVARQIGVNPARLGYWLARGKVRPPKMAARGGRIVWLWTEADIKRVRIYSEKHCQTASLVNHRPGLEARDDGTV